MQHRRRPETLSEQHGAINIPDRSRSMVEATTAGARTQEIGATDANPHIKMLTRALPHKASSWDAKGIDGFWILSQTDDVQ